MNNEEMAKVKAALETGVDLAAAHADETHRAYAGYKPERHASVDRDVADMREALAIVEREAGNPASVRDTTASAAPTIEPVAEAAAQADDGVLPWVGKRLRAVVAELREYAANPGYSHGDYADTMREAADAIEAMRKQSAAAPTAQPTPPDDELRNALSALLKRYGDLAGSGDAGNWDWEAEEVVVAARAALRQPGALPDEADEFARGYTAGWNASAEGWNAEYGGPEVDSDEFRVAMAEARALAAKQAGKEA